MLNLRKCEHSVLHHVATAICKLNNITIEELEATNQGDDYLGMDVENDCVKTFWGEYLVQECGTEAYVTDAWGSGDNGVYFKLNEEEDTGYNLSDKYEITSYNKDRKCNPISLEHCSESVINKIICEIAELNNTSSLNLIRQSEGANLKGAIVTTAFGRYMITVVASSSLFISGMDNNHLKRIVFNESFLDRLRFKVPVKLSSEVPKLDISEEAWSRIW